MECGEPPQSRRRLEQVRDRARYLHYSLSTEKVYLYWVRFFIRCHGMRHPRDMGVPEVEAFLTMVATARQVLNVKLPCLDNIRRPPTDAASRRCSLLPKYPRCWRSSPANPLCWPACPMARACG